MAKCIMLQIEHQWIKPYTNLDYIVQKASKAHCVAVYHVSFFLKIQDKIKFLNYKRYGFFWEHFGHIYWK